MPVPFGFGIGDAVVVGKLIGKIVIELRQNGEAAPEYQSLLLELEALDRALHQLETLRPTQHELIQLNAIRATALTCQRPLQEFLEKIEKFDGRMSVFNARNNKTKGFPRRMQWSLMYKEDVKQLRGSLSSHVATINLLLMTQTIGSITTAESDRERLVCGLEEKVLVHRRLLEEVKIKVDRTVEQHGELKSHLHVHSTKLSSLEDKSNQTHQQLEEQEALLQAMRQTVTQTQGQTSSILSKSIDILAVAASGLMTLRLLANQLGRMFRLCANFTIEMRAEVSKVTILFSQIHSMLQRIEVSLSQRINLPIIQFTDALGETMALPFQLCQQWATFRELLGVIFTGKPGKMRVDRGLFLIMNARGGRILQEASWQFAVKQGDHLSMSVVLDDVAVSYGHCPFPSCMASVDGVDINNGGRTCPECGRWAILINSKPKEPVYEYSGSELSMASSESYWETESDRSSQQDESVTGQDVKEEHEMEVEDIEVYRQIYVQPSYLDLGEFDHTELSRKEHRGLIRAYLRYGSLKVRGDEILRAAGLTGKARSVIREALKDLHWEANQHLLNADRTPYDDASSLDPVVFHLDNVGNIDARAVRWRPWQMRLFQERVEATKHFRNLRIPEASVGVDYSVPWGSREDGMLIVGIHRHGWGAWAEICHDPELAMSDKIFARKWDINNRIANSGVESDDRTPQSKHLERRANYLFRILLDYYDTFYGSGPISWANNTRSF